MNNKELEIYIHIPFCIKKCKYCDFLSFSCGDEMKKDYVEALVNEISGYSFLYKDRIVTSVFIGGGTPSVLQPKYISRIMDTIRKSYNLSDNAEITIESNPGTLSEEKLYEYKSIGINRLSIGLQSTIDTELNLLGRIHDYGTFLESYNLARKCGFENINVDLISGLPNQSLSDFEETLNKVIALKPQHISSYSLIVEEGTEFYELYGENKLKESELPGDELDREMYHHTQNILKKAGFRQYEISNYAMPGYECRHNIGYWIRKDYAGFGIGAASLVNNIRWKNISDINSYIDLLKNNNLGQEFAKIKEDITELCLEEQMEEYMFLGLRMVKGVNICDFKELFGVNFYDVGSYKDYTEKMIEEKLLVVDNCFLRLTDRGLDLANYVMSGYIFER